MLSWIREKFSGEHDPERVFGEESMASQVDPALNQICPRTGRSIHEATVDEPCCLQDGSCEHWAGMDIKVRCLRLGKAEAEAPSAP